MTSRLSKNLEKQNQKLLGDKLKINIYFCKIIFVITGSCNKTSITNPLSPFYDVQGGPVEINSTGSIQSCIIK